ncbi:MAG: DUF2934 domain-containing protein, partial [Actinobacteria bacterium]|nr:DUF2934 domain-containing protein [Actinomycetota bacterium]
VLGTLTDLRRLDRGTGSWSTITSAAVPGGGTATIGQVLGVGWGRSPSQSWCFAADQNAVYWSTDSGSSWTVLRPSGGTGALPPNVRGLAVGTGSDGVTVVYATVLDAGVWRCALPAGSSPSSAPAWQNVSAGLPAAPSQFDQLATCAADPSTVYVGRSQGWDTAPGWTVYAGHFDGTAMTWRGAFDGFTNETANHNVQPGWIDVAEAPAALGFGFGGGPRGLACSPTDPAVVMQVNNAFADLSTTGAPNTTASPYGWQQIYTRPDGPGWQTTGLDVTNVWRYVIHPTKPQLHYLANTDIGLSRSVDSGITWQFVRTRRGSLNWGNCYDLAFGPAGQLWAAVSTEHDLPYDSQLSWEKSHRTDPAYQETDPGNSSTIYQTGPGAVLVSSDDGQTWSELGTGLPDRPVLSVVFGNGTLYAAVWRRGVYQLPGGDPAGSWTAVGDIGGQRRVRRLAFDSSGRLHCIACGTNGEAGLYRWTGSGWQCLTTALAASCTPNFVPFDFSFDPSDSHTYWLATSSVQGGPEGAVWRTSDDGAHWSSVFDITKTGTAYRDFLHVTDVTYDPADLSFGTWYVTTETHGTWYTTDRGTNWKEFGVVPFTAAQRITFDPADHTVLYQATKGAGAWQAMTAAASMSLAQQIRRTAYRTYQARQGRPGDPTADWLAAQQQVLGPAVKTRAYQLYLRRGGQPGHALDDWLRAEQEVVRAIRGF